MAGATVFPAADAAAGDHVVRDVRFSRSQTPLIDHAERLEGNVLVR